MEELVFEQHLDVKGVLKTIRKEGQLIWVLNWYKL